MLPMVRNAINAALLMGAAPFALAAPAQAAGNSTTTVLPVNCERACLTNALEAVLSAIAAKDVSKLPLGNHVKSTQNGVDIGLDDGLWQTVSEIGKYRLYAIDPEEGTAGVYTTMKQGGKRLLVALRIATWEQKIQEIEFVIANGAGGPGGPMANPGDAVERMGQPRPQFLRTIPEKDRESREELTRVADSYFANLQGSTGKTTSPFAPTCNRLENGFQTTNGPAGNAAQTRGVNIIAMGCEAQQKIGFFPFVTSIRDRRFPIVDRERGLVMAFGYFDHNATVQDITLTDGQKMASVLSNPTTFVISETFQIDKGKIDQVEAVLETVPYKMRNAIWKEGDHRTNSIGIPTGN